MLSLQIRELIWDNPAKRDKLLLAGIFLALFLNVAIWVLSLSKFYGYNDYIILDYNIYFGINMLGPWYYVLALPGVGLALAVIDYLLAFWVYLKSPLASYFLASAAVAVNLLIIIAVFFLSFIN